MTYLVMRRSVTPPMVESVTQVATVFDSLEAKRLLIKEINLVTYQEKGQVKLTPVAKGTYYVLSGGASYHEFWIEELG